ncbi:MAG: prephenate dehydrogenase [Candidatus Melainabacteria bacterium]
MTSPFSTITIVGLGLIGGSLASAVRERAPEIRLVAVDEAEEPLQYALRHNLVDAVSRTLPDALEDNQLVILACHLPGALAALKTLAPLAAGKDVLITDVGSCKRRIVALGEAVLPAQFIAGHPMAGREFSGVSYATSLLFTGKPWLLCPNAETDAGLLARLTAFVEMLGAVPRIIEAEKHDAYMAYVSHLPQLYSILLTNLLHRHDPAELLSYHGGGIDDQLRLAASSHAMWGPVFEANQDNLRTVLQELAALFQEASEKLDSPEMAEWFRRSNGVHQAFQQVRASRAGASAATKG